MMGSPGYIREEPQTQFPGRNDNKIAQVSIKIVKKWYTVYKGKV